MEFKENDTAAWWTFKTGYEMSMLQTLLNFCFSEAETMFLQLVMEKEKFSFVNILFFQAEKDCLNRTVMRMGESCPHVSLCCFVCLLFLDVKP